MLASVAEGPSTLENGATGSSVWLLEPQCFGRAFPKGLFVGLWAAHGYRVTLPC